MQSTKFKLILFILLVLGICIFCFGFIIDPFSIPFQDYEQLPVETQLAYEAQARIAKPMQLFGASMFVICAAALLLLALFKKKNNQGSK